MEYSGVNISLCAIFMTKHSLFGNTLLNRLTWRFFSAISLASISLGEKKVIGVFRLVSNPERMGRSLVRRQISNSNGILACVLLCLVFQSSCWQLVQYSVVFYFLSFNKLLFKTLKLKFWISFSRVVASDQYVMNSPINFNSRCVTSPE